MFDTGINDIVEDHDQVRILIVKRPHIVPIFGGNIVIVAAVDINHGCVGDLGITVCDGERPHGAKLPGGGSGFERGRQSLDRGLDAPALSEGGNRLRVPRFRGQCRVRGEEENSVAVRKKMVDRLEAG